MITQVGIYVLGLGLAIPCTGIVLINSCIKIIAGKNYELDIKKVGYFYMIALLGWFLVFGVRI
jgi:hypothetical protein